MTLYNIAKYSTEFTFTIGIYFYIYFILLFETVTTGKRLRVSYSTQRLLCDQYSKSISRIKLKSGAILIFEFVVFIIANIDTTANSAEYGPLLLYTDGSLTRTVSSILYGENLLMDPNVIFFACCSIDHFELFLLFYTVF